MPKIINDLFWEKYRPKSLNNMVILPRIKEELSEGFQRNYLLYGHQGTGKSTIVRILLKDKDFMRINASKSGRIDMLRDQMEEFCTTMKSPLIKSPDKMKYVYLEEFEGSTKDFQEAFKAFIEDYDKNVRFIITMNDLASIKVEPLLSRFNPLIKFDPINDFERNYLHDGYFKYLNAISKHAELNVKEETIRNLINTYFPDVRSAVEGLHVIYITGKEDVEITETYADVYQFILNNKTSFEDIYNFVVDNYTNRPKELMSILGRPFYKYLKSNNSEIITNKGFDLIDISRQYNSEFESTIDPVIHLISYLSDIKRTIIK